MSKRTRLTELTLALVTLGKLRHNLDHIENFPICETVFDILILIHIFTGFAFPATQESFYWRVDFLMTLGIIVLSFIYTDPQLE